MSAVQQAVPTEFGGVIDLVAEAKRIEVKTQAGYDLACEQLKAVADMKALALSTFKPMRKAYAAYQKVLKLNKSVMDPIEEAERILKGGIAAFLTGQEGSPHENGI